MYSLCVGFFFVSRCADLLKWRIIAQQSWGSLRGLTMRCTYHIAARRLTERFERDLNLKSDLIHTIFMRSDFMPGRFACGTDNIVVTVQGPENTTTLRSSFKSIGHKGSIKWCDRSGALCFYHGQTFKATAKQVTLDCWDSASVR